MSDMPEAPGASDIWLIERSRVYIADARLQVDLGRASAVALPEEEARRHKEATNPEWPIMRAVLHGVTRDQFMARHKANHLNVAYAPDAEAADRALAAKAAMFAALGLEVHVCGEYREVPGREVSPAFRGRRAASGGADPSVAPRVTEGYGRSLP